jgi:hypothetical protein
LGRWIVGRTVLKKKKRDSCVPCMCWFVQCRFHCVQLFAGRERQRDRERERHTHKNARGDPGSAFALLTARPPATVCGASRPRAASGRAGWGRANAVGASATHDARASDCASDAQASDCASDAQASASSDAASETARGCRRCRRSRPPERWSPAACRWRGTLTPRRPSRACSGTCRGGSCRAGSRGRRRRRRRRRHGRGQSQTRPRRRRHRQRPAGGSSGTRCRGCSDRAESRGTPADRRQRRAQHPTRRPQHRRLRSRPHRRARRSRHRRRAAEHRSLLKASRVEPNEAEAKRARGSERAREADQANELVSEHRERDEACCNTERIGCFALYPSHRRPRRPLARRSRLRCRTLRRRRTWARPRRMRRRTNCRRLRRALD